MSQELFSQCVLHEKVDYWHIEGWLTNRLFLSLILIDRVASVLSMQTGVGPEFIWKQLIHECCV